MSARSLQYYLDEVKKFPFLTREEEQELARRWVAHQDKEAQEQLVSAHLRLVVKIAYQHRNYGLPLEDLIAYGNIGVVQATKYFNPELGYRFSTYAMWWIGAAIKEYVLRSWSLVKMGTTAAQKKLFFNLRSIKWRLHIDNRSPLKEADAERIAQEVCVAVKDVYQMDERLSAVDVSLNSPIGIDSQIEQIDMLKDESPPLDELLGQKQELERRQGFLKSSMSCLNEREHDILHRRWLNDAPDTLDVIGQEYGISRERVRQIEAHAFMKLRRAIKQKDKTCHL